MQFLILDVQVHGGHKLRWQHLDVIGAENGVPLQSADRRIFPPDVRPHLLCWPREGCAVVRLHDEGAEPERLEMDETPSGEEACQIT